MLMDKLAHRGIDENYDCIQRVPVRWRQTVSELGRDADLPVPDDLPEKVVDAIWAMRGNTKSIAARDGNTPPLSRNISAPIRRTKGERDEIIAQVAGQFGCSERRVRTAWTDYRKLLRYLAQTAL